VTENIVRRGRNRGIGITLITQRPAVLNKDVLTQVDGLVAMRIVGLTDRKAIDEWVKGHGDDEPPREVKGTLSGLANGECWWWVPELDVLKRVQVRASRTFDSSPTKQARREAPRAEELRRRRHGRDREEDGRDDRAREGRRTRRSSPPPDRDRERGAPQAAPPTATSGRRRRSSGSSTRSPRSRRSASPPPTRRSSRSSPRPARRARATRTTSARCARPA
jgi:hypothetical protein